MVKIELTDEEIKALDLLMKDAKTPIDLGWVLQNLKIKIGEAWKKEFESKQKELAKQLMEGGKGERKKD
jgi:hypothetical protein